MDKSKHFFGFILAQSNCPGPSLIKKKSEFPKDFPTNSENFLLSDFS
jgi:hypothetical protein